MAIGPIQINDMKWFGNPTDLVGSFQKGMNLAEQSQKMGQSSDVHAMKLVDMASTTAARDQQTSLNAQRERFNDLNQENVLRHSKASAAAAEYGATIQGVNSRVAAATEQTATSAKEAGFLRFIAESDTAIRNQQNLLNKSRAEAEIMMNRSLISTATVWNDIERDNLGLDMAKNAVERDGYAINAAREAEALRSEGVPKAAMYKGQMDLAYEAGYHDIIDNMIFSGVTAPQEAELEAHRSGIRQTNNYVKYAQSRNAANAMIGVEQQQGLTSWAMLKPKQRGMFNAKGSDGKPLYTNPDGTLNDDGLDLADRTSKWNKLTEGMRETDKLKISNAILKLDGTVGVLSAKQKSNTSFMSSYSNPFGDFVNGEFVPNGAGLDEAADLVRDFKARQAAARLSMVKGEGHVVKAFTINDDGSISFETERGFSTAKEVSPRILAELKVLREQNALRDKPLTDIQMIKAAKERVYGTEMKFALNAAEARGQGLKIGDTFFNANPSVMKVQRFADPTTLPSPAAKPSNQSKPEIPKLPSPDIKIPIPAPVPLPSRESSADDAFKSGQQQGQSQQQRQQQSQFGGQYQQGNMPPSPSVEGAASEEPPKSAGSGSKIAPRESETVERKYLFTEEGDASDRSGPQMDEITIRSARRNLRLGAPISQQEINALINRYPVPKDMPAENIKIINMARSGAKLAPQEKKLLEQMNIDPKTGIPIGKVKIVKLPPRPTLNPKK